jgi:hypothetical protein
MPANSIRPEIQLLSRHAIHLLLYLAILVLSVTCLEARAINASEVFTNDTAANLTRVTRSSNNNEPTKNETPLKFPFHVLVVLPMYESIHDKFGLTIPKAQPVIEIAVDEIEARELLPKGWIQLRYEDSKYWEDPTLAEKHAVNAVIKAQCEGKLDTVIGLADPYSLATIAKISAGFGNGIPVIKCQFYAIMHCYFRSSQRRVLTIC